MKIAILMAGHLRFWKLCKNNFINFLCNTEYKVDVFIDTYNRRYRSDYAVNGENKVNNPILDEKELISEFENINVVSFSMEPEIIYHPQNLKNPQSRKLLRVYDSFCEYELKNNISYDIVVKTRFDIVLKKPLNYNFLADQCTSKNKIIYISRGVVNCIAEENDMFAVTDRETFHLYSNRHREYPDIMCPHHTIRLMAKNNGVKCIPSIDISIYRFDENGKPKLRD